MNNSGQIRQMDKVGRVAVPVSVRKALGLVPGDNLEFSIDGNTVVLQRYTKTCMLCGTDHDVSPYRTETRKGLREVYLCRNCRSELGKSEKIGG